MLILPNCFYVVIYQWHWSNMAETFIKHSCTKPSWTNVTENRSFNLQSQGTLFILEFFKASCIKFSACTASRKKEKEKKNQWWKNIKVMKVLLIKSCGCLFLWNIIWYFGWFLAYRTCAIITRGLYIFYPIFQCGL